MLRFLSVMIGSLLLGSLVFLLIEDSTSLSMKSLFGFGWSALVFFGFYFALTKEMKWKSSPKYAASKMRYAALISIGEDVRLAEKRIMKSMILEDIADGIRSVPGLGIRKIRVSIFTDANAELRVLSYQGQVFGADVTPKQKSDQANTQPAPLTRRG